MLQPAAAPSCVLPPGPLAWQLQVDVQNRLGHLEAWVRLVPEPHHGGGVDERRVRRAVLQGDRRQAATRKGNGGVEAQKRWQRPPHSSARFSGACSTSLVSDYPAAHMVALMPLCSCRTCPSVAVSTLLWKRVRRATGDKLWQELAGPRNTRRRAAGQGSAGTPASTTQQGWPEGLGIVLCCLLPIAMPFASFQRPQPLTAAARPRPPMNESTPSQLQPQERKRTHPHTHRTSTNPNCLGMYGLGRGRCSSGRGASSRHSCTAEQRATLCGEAKRQAEAAAKRESSQTVQASRGNPKPAKALAKAGPASRVVSHQQPVLRQRAHAVLCAVPSLPLSTLSLQGGGIGREAGYSRQQACQQPSEVAKLLRSAAAGQRAACGWED